MYPAKNPESTRDALALAAAIGSGERPGDDDFDQFLSDDLRLVSKLYWTPLEVAFQAAAWLDELKLRTVVDVGSGAGKFCVSAALASRCTFTGVEQRPHLVTEALALAQRFGVEHRVHFVEGTLGRTALPAGDVYYFFNPFGENLFGPVDHLDDSVELTVERYKRDVRAAVKLLQTAPLGTCALTYNGFGGTMPDGYVMVKVDRSLANPLRLWRKVAVDAELPPDAVSDGAPGDDLAPPRSRSHPMRSSPA